MRPFRATTPSAEPSAPPLSVSGAGAVSKVFGLPPLLALSAKRCHCRADHSYWRSNSRLDHFAEVHKYDGRDCSFGLVAMQIVALRRVLDCSHLEKCSLVADNCLIPNNRLPPLPAAHRCEYSRRQVPMLCREGQQPASVRPDRSLCRRPVRRGSCRPSIECRHFRQSRRYGSYYCQCAANC